MFRDQIIPRAVLFYTGEAITDEDYMDDFEADDDDEVIFYITDNVIELLLDLRSYVNNIAVFAYLCVRDCFLNFIDYAKYCKFSINGLFII